MLTLAEYLHYRHEVLQVPEGRELLKWIKNIRRPVNAEDMANLLIGVILSSGFSYETAQSLLPRILKGLRERTRLYPGTFGHEKKVRAIEEIWRERNALFTSLSQVGSLGDAFNWCETLPYIRGPVLRFQAVRDLGLADVAKPDRLMERIASGSGEEVQALCHRLSEASGDSIGTVDLVLWFAASKEIIKGIRMRGRRPACHALPANFRPPPRKR